MTAEQIAERIYMRGIGRDEAEALIKEALHAATVAHESRISAAGRAALSEAGHE